VTLERAAAWPIDFIERFLFIPKKYNCKLDSAETLSPRAALMHSNTQSNLQ